MGERAVAWLIRRHRAVLVIALAVVALGAVGASRLELRAGLEELLPTGDPRVEALKEIERRMGSFSSLAVVTRSPDRAANVAWARDFGRRIETDSPGLVDRASVGLPEMRAFVEAHRWLYADLPLLEGLRDRIAFDLLRAKNPLFVALEEPPTLDELRDRIDHSRGEFSRLPDGLFVSQKGDVAVVVVLPARNLTSADDDRVVAAAQQAIARVPLPPGASVSLGGDVHTAVEERRAIAQDVQLTTALVVVLVAAVVGAYFGRLRAVPLMTLPALAGVTIAFGVAGVAFGALNASTAFLGAIIVGNGINYPIIALGRYAEERARARPTRDSLRLAIDGTARATSLAALAAAAAYGSLALTSFRGFSQFGIIGAVGMTLCWIAAFTVLPAVLWVLDRRRPAAPERPRRVNLGLPFAWIVERAPIAALAIGAALTAAALAALPHWLSDPFEYEFSNLRTRHREDPAAEHSLDEMFGRTLSPQVLLARNLDEARRAALALRRRARAEGSRSPIAHVVTIDDVLPGTPEEQQEKIELIGEIRRLLADPAIKLLSDKQRARIADLRPPADVRPLAIADLPALARRPFEERDGTVGNVVLVYPPRTGFSITNGRDLMRLTDAIEAVPSEIGVPVASTGRALIFAAMVSSIAHDGPRATFASFAVVAALTLIVLRGRAGALLVLGTLFLGVLWMLGAAAMLDLKIDFLNFVALPITFGIGIDYSANIYLRYRADRGASIGRIIATTGGAVALNSATTIIGYGSLLIAHNRALVSFGALAIIGEVACLLSALLVMPALLALRDRLAPGAPRAIDHLH